MLAKLRTAVSGPLAVHISTVFGLLIVVTCLSLSWISYDRTVKLISRHGQEVSDAAARELQIQIESLFTPVELGVSLLRHDRINLVDTLPLRLSSIPVFVEALERNRSVSSYFVGYEDGDFFLMRRLDDDLRPAFDVSPDTAYLIQSIDHERGFVEGRFISLDSEGFILDDAENNAYAERYDPRTRAWYEAAIAENSIIRTSPYVFATTQDIGLTVAYRSDIGPAVVGADLSLSVLSRVVAHLKPTPNAEVALVDSNGQLLGYEDTTKIVNKSGGAFMQRSLNNFAVQPIRALADINPDQNDRAQKRYTIDGKDWVGQVLAIPSSNSQPIYLYVAIPEEELLSAALAIRDNMLMFALAIMLVAVVSATLLSRWLSKPIRNLKAVSDRVMSLDLTKRPVSYSPIVEIRGLQNSMEGMRTTLETFVRYVPIDLVRELIESGRRAEVGGSRQEITLLFSDIAGFTKITEKMSPEIVLKTTSRYFEALTNALMQNEGVIDKYIGDAIMAMWNAPNADARHIEHACLGALAALDASEQLNVGLENEGFPALYTRFGLNTGEAHVGNMGASDRLQFTSLGSTVNLTARIEGLNKIYGTQILVTSSIRDKAPEGMFAFRRVDLVMPAGTTIPVAIYELLGTHGPESAFPVSDTALQSAIAYEAAFDRYLAQGFDEAIGLFRKIVIPRKEDKTIAVMIERCERYLERPPPNGWDGVAEYRSK